MKGLKTLQREISIGHRLVSVSRLAYGLNNTRTLESPQIERIVEIDGEARRNGHNITITLEGPSGRRDVVMAHTGFVYDAKRTILWSEPLPDDDEEAIALVAAAYMRSDSHSSLLFWVGKGCDGLAYCHLITDRIHAEEPVMKAAGGMYYAPHGIPMRLPTDVSEGMLIGVDRVDATLEDGLIIHKPRNVQIVMRNKTLAQAAALPAAPRRRSEFAGGNFGGMYEINNAEELAIAVSEPSEALVLVWSDGDRQETTVLGSSGIAFHQQDDVAIYLEDKIPGPGLWSFVDAKMYGSYSYEGEYDQDLEGSAIPADHAAIERLFGPIEELPREVLEITGEVGDADTLIAQAIASENSEREAEKARKTAAEATRAPSPA